jgi:hypothetical protein
MAVQLALTLPATSRLDLTEEERADLVRVLRNIVANDRFPFSPCIQRRKRILSKLEGSGQGTEPSPPAEPSRRG